MFTESEIQKSLGCKESIPQWRAVLNSMLKSLRYITLFFLSIKGQTSALKVAYIFKVFGAQIYLIVA